MRVTVGPTFRFSRLGRGVGFGGRIRLVSTRFTVYFGMRSGPPTCVPGPPNRPPALEPSYVLRRATTTAWTYPTAPPPAPCMSAGLQLPRLSIAAPSLCLRKDLLGRVRAVPLGSAGVYSIRPALVPSARGGEAVAAESCVPTVRTSFRGTSLRCRCFPAFAFLFCPYDAPSFSISYQTGACTLVHERHPVLHLPKAF